MNELKHIAGWLLAFAWREAVRYPWPAAVVGLLAVIWVLRRVPRVGGSPSSSQSPTVVVPGVVLGAVVIAAAIAGVAWFMQQKPAAVAAAPAPKVTVTQKVVHPTIIQHITHVTAQSHTGLYVLIGFAIVFVVFMVLRLNGRA